MPPGVAWKSRPALWTSILAALLLTAGCERPFDRTPPGFKEACYGENPKRNWLCSERRLVVSTHGAESDWPLIGKIVADVGRSHSLEVFDVGGNDPGHVRTLEVYACSADGLMMSVDKRIYERPAANRGGDAITVELRTYKNSYDWEPLAETLVSALQTKWPRQLRVERPEPLGSNRALPDDVPDCEE